MNPGELVGGRYRLERAVGRGAFGQVWRAADPAGKPVAVKLLLIERGQGHEQARRRFEAEAQALLRVRHPHVAGLLGAGVDQAIPWLALSWVEGETWQEVVEREGPLEPRRAAGIVEKLARGLAEAHAAGVLHRDLKPGNVMCRAGDGEPVLIDFGLARDLEPSLSRSAVTREGCLLGTPGYWAPEQARGERAAIGARTDVYGLGAVLFFLLTAHPPQAGETLAEVLTALVSEPRAPSTLRPAVPREVDRLVLRCLARAPEARFAGAEDVADALAAWLDPAPRGPSRAALAAAAATGLTLAVGLGWLLARGRDRPREPDPEPAPAVTVASAAPVGPTSPAPATAPRGWVERIALEADLPTPRPELLQAAGLMREIEAARARQRAPGEPDWTPAQEPVLRRGAAAGMPYAQRRLAQLLVRPGGPQDGAREAAELLWMAMRPPVGDPRAAVELAELLAHGWGALEADPAAARALLLRVAGPAAERDLELEERAACVWLALHGPGDLARAVELLRRDRGGAPEQLRGAGPTGTVALAIALREGWRALGAPPAKALREALASPEPVRGAARAWLDLTAAAGDPEAKELLAGAGLQTVDPGQLDPRDLLALSGTRAVRRPTEPLQGADAELVAAACDAARGLDERPAEAARLRQLALLGHAEAQWGMSQSLWKAGGATRDRRAAVAWAALATLDPHPSSGGPPGLARPGVRVGRALLLGVDGPAAPALARACLERGRAQLLQGRGGSPFVTATQGIGAELWLGLAEASGRGFPRDTAAGLERIRAVLTSDSPALASLDEAAQEGDAWAAWLRTQLEPRPRAKQRVRLYRQAIAAGIEEARLGLESEWRRDPEVAYRLALEHPRGSPEQKELLERAIELPEAAMLLRLIREAAPELEATLRRLAEAPE